MVIRNSDRVIDHSFHTLILTTAIHMYVDIANAVSSKSLK